jgi:uncharacterized protein YukE
MAGGYQVDPAELANGSKLIQGVSDQAEAISNALAGTFASMTGAVDDDTLAGALADADGSAVARMLDVLALLGHIGETLSDNARSYQQTEDQNADSVKTAGKAVR